MGNDLVNKGSSLLTATGGQKDSRQGSKEHSIMQVTKTFSLGLHKDCPVKTGAQPEVYDYVSCTETSKKAKVRKYREIR